MKKAPRFTVLVIVLLMILCFSLGFGVWTVGLDLLQPAGPPGSPTITFVIREGENTSQIADDLVAQHLIRNALAFRLWARYQNLDRQLQAGAYQLSASMTISDIVHIFLTSPPSQFWVTIPEGLRVWQIAKRIAASPKLVKFKPDDFIQIAKTGAYTDAQGNTVSLAAHYWFLNHGQQANSPPLFVLEGYLFPDTYLIDQNATTSDIVQTLLTNFGKHLCPGPNDHSDAYVRNEQQCEAHGSVLDQASHQTVFDLLKKRYSNADGANMADKIFHALTLASIVEREALTAADHQGIAAVYYKRYLVSKNEITPPEDGLSKMQSDPTVAYALGAPDNPWPQLQDAGNNYNVGPYNTYHTEGLPPGPICNPGFGAFQAVSNPPDTPYYYFIGTKDGKIVYAKTYQEQLNNIKQYGLPPEE